MNAIWIWWWAVVPVAINVLGAALQTGPVTPMIIVVTGVFAVVSGLSAPILFYCASKTRTWAGFVTLVTIGLLAHSINVFNAIEASARLSDRVSDPRRVTIENRDRLTTQSASLQTEIARLRGQTQGDGPEVIRAYIQKLKVDKIYARSRQCQDVTLDDSQALCSTIAGAKMRLGAAEKIERLEVDLKRIWGKLTEIETAPRTEDPGVSILAGFVASVDEHNLRAIIDGWKAIVLELLCSLMPAILSTYFRQPPVAQAAAAVAFPEPQEEETPFTRWAEHRLRRSDGKVRAGEAQRSFLEWCEVSGTPPPKSWRTTLPKAMAAMGFERDDKGAYVHYVNVSIVSGNLRIVQ